MKTTRQQQWLKQVLLTSEELRANRNVDVWFVNTVSLLHQQLLRPAGQFYMPQGTGCSIWLQSNKQGITPLRFLAFVIGPVLGPASSFAASSEVALAAGNAVRAPCWLISGTSWMVSAASSALRLPRAGLNLCTCSGADLVTRLCHMLTADYMPALVANTLHTTGTSPSCWAAC